MEKLGSSTPPTHVKFDPTPIKLESSPQPPPSLLQQFSKEEQQQQQQSQQQESLPHAFPAKPGTPATSSSMMGKKRPAQYTPHPSECMLAAQWHGTRSIYVSSVPRPILSCASDAIIDITSTSISGADLHLYNNALQGHHLHSEDIVGHEAVGIVREVGSEVASVKVGDRVVVSAVIACGNCRYCKQEQYSLCDCTNPSSALDSVYGHRLSGVFGFTSSTGGYAGLQAEVARVPFADVNLLKIDNDDLTDDQILLLSEVMCTAWHGCMLGEVSSTDNVVIWGCGPIGLMCGYLAKKVLKANRVICIDNVPSRLRLALNHGCEIVNFDDADVIQTLQKNIPGGADVCIDCVGFRFPKSASQKFMFHTGMQTDAIDIIKEAIFVCKKAGRICLIGDYFGKCNNFPLGALMEKSITLRGGQLFTQKYWKYLLLLINSGEIDGSWLFSHRMPLGDIDKAYELFNARKENCTKILLHTQRGDTLARVRGQQAAAAKLADIKLMPHQPMIQHTHTQPHSEPTEQTSFEHGTFGSDFHD